MADREGDKLSAAAREYRVRVDQERYAATRTCFAMPAGSSSPTTATTRGLYSTTSGTRTFSTQSGTPTWYPTASRTFGADRRRQARDDFRLPLNHFRALAGSTCQHFLNHLNGLI